MVAQALGISHHHLHRISKMDAKDQKLRQQIEQTWQTHPGYGHVRLGLHLDINKKRVRRVMRKFGIKPPRRKVRKHWCTTSTQNHTYTNLIKDLVATRPHQIWASDVSFFKFKGQWWYVASIIDLYTRQIVAAQVSRHHDRWLILSVSKQAVQTTRTTPDVFHSDQGTEFMARACTVFWQEQQVAVSVSDTGSPWQNGYKESYFGHFKDDLGNIDRFNSPGEFIAAIYSQVNYYNHERIHTALKMPPAKFAQLVSENPRHIWGT